MFRLHSVARFGFTLIELLVVIAILGVLVSEKSLHADSHDPHHGANLGSDNNAVYQGYEYDTVRWASGYVNPANGSTPWMPRSDREGPRKSVSYRFGSSHPGVFRAAYCDGSLHVLAFDLDPKRWEKLGSRNDGGGPCGVLPYSANK